jgi:hypothetical protein
MSNSQGRLADFFQKFVVHNNHHSSTKWLKYEDTYSKTFFDFHLIGKKKTILKELEAEGEIITGYKYLFQYIIGFYANLYASEAYAQGISEAQERCWQSVLVRVMEAMNVSMTKDLTLKEIVEAITSLPKGKAPRHDDIPTKFFQEYVEEVAPTLLMAFKAMLAHGRTSNHINKGLITLIPKSKDHSKLENWRPITLLGNTYKILAKTLAERIHASFPGNQTKSNRIRKRNKYYGQHFFGTGCLGLGN